MLKEKHLKQGKQEFIKMLVIVKNSKKYKINHKN